MPPRRAPRQRPRPSPQILRDLHAEVLRRLPEGVAGGQGFGFLCGPQGALRLQALRAGDVALPCGQDVPPLPLQRNHGRAACALARREGGGRAKDCPALPGERLAPREHEPLGVCPEDEQKGEIAQWVWNKWNKQGSVESLENFANSCKMEGEKLIAVETVSVFNDRYFGQWLALRSPFRALEDLIDPAVAEKVPEEYQHLGSALARCPEHWSNEEAGA